MGLWSHTAAAIFLKDCGVGNPSDRPVVHSSHKHTGHSTDNSGPVDIRLSKHKKLFLLLESNEEDPDRTVSGQYFRTMCLFVCLL